MANLGLSNDKNAAADLDHIEGKRAAEIHHCTLANFIVFKFYVTNDFCKVLLYRSELNSSSIGALLTNRRATQVLLMPLLRPRLFCFVLMS